MKKFTALALAVLFMMFVTSCGDDKTTEETLPDEEVTDEDKDEPTDEPTNPTDEPTNPTDEPTNPTDEPTNPTDEPTNPTDEPTDPTGEPTTDNDTPGDDADNNTQDDDVIVIPDGDNTEPADADEIPDEEVETGSCTYIPNSFVSNWTDNFPTGWVSKRDLTGAITVGGKKNFIDYEKIDRGEGNYALRAYINDPSDNLYAFELPPFVPNKNDAALPTKLTFDLKASSTSKISINLRCGDTGTTEDKKYLAYNWKQDLKSFVYSGNNAYDFVNLEDNEYHEVAVVFGDKLTEEFWRGKICRIEFKYGRKKEEPSADFDIVVDNFVFHTKAGACEQDDIIDEENDDDILHDADEVEDADEIVADEDEIVTDADEIETDADEVEDADEITADEDEIEDADEITDGDSEPEIECIQIPNGDFSGTWDSTTGLPEGWTKGNNGSNLTFSQDTNGAFHIQHTNTVTTKADNKYATHSPEIVVPADAEVPAGIRFQLATNIASLISINLRWSEGNDVGLNYYPYNWDEASKAFVKGSQNAYNRVDFGDTNLHNVEIIFGSEMTETLWRGKTFNLEIKYGNRYKDNGTDWTYYNFDISVKDFVLVYYGGTCGNVTDTYTVGYAGVQSPESVEGYVGMTETFYGKLWIDNLTNLTYNQTVYLMGVKGQFGVKKQGELNDYTWYDAEPNVKNATLGNDDEYMYKNYTFPEVGDFEYTFRFSTDNGNTWPLEAMAESKQAKILALPEGQIANGDFKYWLSDNTTPQLWTHEDTAEFSKWNDAETLKVKATGSKKYVLVSPEFELSSTAKAISFKMAMSEGIKAAFFIICDGTTKQYQWDSESHKFVKGSNYNTINFTDNSVLNETSIQAEEGTLTGTCYFKFRIDTSSEIWVAFDDFAVVYE